MNGKVDEFFCVCATVCSTWVPINKGTSLRCPSSILGNQNLPSVQAGNLLASRSIAPNNQIVVLVYKFPRNIVLKWGKCFLGVDFFELSTL